MVNNFSSFKSGLSSGVVQDQYIDLSPMYTYVIYPTSSTNSTVYNGGSPIAALPVVQSEQPTWVIKAGSTTGYEVINELQWNITFGSTSNVYYNGTPVCVFDCLRAAQVVFSSAPDNAGQYTINGWDDRGVEVVAQGSFVAGTATQVFPKAFKAIRSMYFSIYPWTDQSDANTVLIQGSSNFGLPHFINNEEFVTAAYWNNEQLDASNIFAGNLWRTGTVSATSADARGYISLIGESQQPDGLHALIVSYYIYGNDQKLNDQAEAGAAQQQLYLSNANRRYPFNFGTQPGSSFRIMDLQNNTQNKVVMPSLVTQDVYGAQFPGDLPFMINYTKLVLA